MMKRLGHYQSVPISNSKRTVKIYVPHFVEKIFPPVIITGLFLLGFYSTGEKILSTKPTVLFGFFLFPALLDFFYISYRITSDKNTKRMINGELISKTGELYEISKWSTDPKGVRAFYRFAIKGYDLTGEFFDEIYEMPTVLYNKHINRYTNAHGVRKRNCCSGFAYLVEVVFLPPLKTPEFSYLEPSSKLRKPNHNNINLPISKSEVVEIFYKKKLSYDCKIGDDALFARW